MLVTSKSKNFTKKKLLAEEDVDFSVIYSKYYENHDVYTVKKVGRNVFNIKNTKVLSKFFFVFTKIKVKKWITYIAHDLTKCNVMYIK